MILERENLQRLPIWRPGISPEAALRRTVTAWIWSREAMLVTSMTSSDGCGAGEALLGVLLKRGWRQGFGVSGESG
jgi:hypothetical protein